MLELSHIWLAGAPSSWLRGPSDKYQWSLSTSLLSGGKKKKMSATHLFPFLSPGIDHFGTRMLFEEVSLRALLLRPDPALYDLGPVPFPFLSQTFSI